MAASTTASGYVVNLGAVGIVGTFLGMPIEALILGAIAGAVAQGLNPIGGRVKGISTVLTSTMLAGAFSPALTQWLIQLVDWSDSFDEGNLFRPVSAVLIGAAWPWAVPLIADGARKFWTAFVVSWIDRIGGGK